MEISPIENILIGIEEDEQGKHYIPTVWLGAPAPRVLELDWCNSEQEALEAVHEFIEIHKKISEQKGD